MGDVKVLVDQQLMKDVYEQLTEARDMLGYEMGGGERNPYGFKRIRQCQLKDVKPGELFEDEHDLYILSQYHYQSDEHTAESMARAQWLVIILGTGEYAHFKDNNNHVVWQLEQPVKLNTEENEDHD